MKKYLLLLYIFGQLLILFAFLELAEHLPLGNLVFDIIISSVVFVLWFIDPMLPWVNQNDTSQTSISSLGIRWYFIGLYSFLAISFLIYSIFSHDPPSLSIQILIHSCLLFLFFFGWVNSKISEKLASIIFNKNQSSKKSLYLIKSNAIELLQKSISKGATQNVIDMFNKFIEEIKYVSPIEIHTSNHIDNQIMQTFTEIDFGMNSLQIDWDEIYKRIKICLQLLSERKRFTI